MLKNSFKLFSFICAMILKNSSCDLIDVLSFPSVSSEYRIEDPINFSRKVPFEDFQNHILFKYYKNGKLNFIGNGISKETLFEVGCSSIDRFAFLMHGWRESCEIDWMLLLIAKLTTHRGGCIICIDFGRFTADSYIRLVRQFESISNVITSKLKKYQIQGFNPSEAYMFGFSYGGQLACSVGKKLGSNLIKEIDTCDMAGPGFDYKNALIDNRQAAQNVQCIHTTRDMGTRHYNCHQNWRMGNCGINQLGAKDPPRGSHGLCPIFYISAFDNDFYAMEKPERCTSKRPAQSWPQNFKMGYMERRKSLVEGELFAATSTSYPFTVPISQYHVNQPIGFYDILQNLKLMDRPIKKARNLLKITRRNTL